MALRRDPGLRLRLVLLIAPIDWKSGAPDRLCGVSIPATDLPGLRVGQPQVARRSEVPYCTWYVPGMLYSFYGTFICRFSQQVAARSVVQVNTRCVLVFGAAVLVFRSLPNLADINPQVSASERISNCQYARFLFGLILPLNIF